MELAQDGHLDFDTVLSSMLLYVHRDHKDHYGRRAQDGHLDFSHTAPKLCGAGSGSGYRDGVKRVETATPVMPERIDPTHRHDGRCE